MFEQELHDHIVKLRKRVESEVETRQSTNKQIVKSVVDTCDKMASNMDQLRKGMLDSKMERNLVQLYIAIKRSKNALKSEKLNESMKMLNDTKTRFLFERSVYIETFQEKAVCLGDLKDTEWRDAVIHRSKDIKTRLYYTVLYVGSSHMSFGVSSVSDPNRVTSKAWCAGGHISNKAPTSLLIYPDGKSVCAFGYEADQKYSELLDDKEEENYFYFHGDYDLSMYRGMEEKRTFALDVSGKKLTSIVVLSTLIRVLKKEAMRSIKQNLQLCDGDVYFVITFPDRFETARYAMDDAVVQAGIDSKDFTIAFETEAAFMYIQDSANYFEYPESPVKQFREGSRYLVLDAKGQIIMQRFMTTCPEDYRDMMSSIHEKVSAVKTQKNHTDIRNVVAYKLFDFVQIHTGGTVKDLLRKRNTEGKIKVSDSKLGIDSSIWIQFFRRSISTITSHIHSIQDKKSLDCIAIVMIGGFSNSKILQDGLRREFPDLQVVVPKSPENAIILGANALGHLTSVDRKE